MQSEESNTLVKLAKTVIEHAPEGGDAFWGIKFSDIKAALSAAEPIRWMWEELRSAESDIWDDMYDDEPPAPHKYVRNVRPLYAALSAQVQDVAGWQPIETIRKNSSAITCSWWKGHKNRPFIQEGYLDWDGKTWKRQSGQGWQPEISHPTLWMPLPAAPAKQEG